MKSDKSHGCSGEISDPDVSVPHESERVEKCRQYGIDPSRLPGHVAIIMDGNGRWAKKRLMNRVRGHEKGSETVRVIVTICRELGIKFLTLYAFSTENWSRPAVEVQALMSLLKKFVISEKETLHRQGIRLDMIGQKRKLPADVREEIDAAIAYTAANSDMCLNLALSYGGREEILHAVRKISSKVKKGKLTSEKITEETIARHLYTGNIPDPDMVVRTSGEMRLSNFLLWQSGYAELFFTETLWPDFTEQEFAAMVKEYQSRDRRFGKVVCSSNDGSQQ